MGAGQLGSWGRRFTLPGLARSLARAHAHALVPWCYVGASACAAVAVRSDGLMPFIVGFVAGWRMVGMGWVWAVGRLVWSTETA